MQNWKKFLKKLKPLLGLVAPKKMASLLSRETTEIRLWSFCRKWATKPNA